MYLDEFEAKERTMEQFCSTYQLLSTRDDGEHGPAYYFIHGACDCCECSGIDVTDVDARTDAHGELYEFRICADCVHFHANGIGNEMEWLDALAAGYSPEHLANLGEN